MVEANRTYWAVGDTPVGPVAVVRGDRGYVRVHLPEPGGRRALRSRIQREHPGATEDPAACADGIAAVEAWARTGAVPAGVPIDLPRATDFRKRIYGVLRRVRPGRTLSYGELAAKAGRPGAARAVGAAMAANPLPLFIPCHRVLTSDGRFGGFTAEGGVALKERMLRHEGGV